MSWKICFPGGGEAAQSGLAKVCAAVASHEGYSPEIGDVIPLTEESDLIILALRQGNACQPGYFCLPYLFHIAALPCEGMKISC